MKKIKVKRIKSELFTKEEYELISKIYNQCNNRKLKKAKRNLEAFEPEELLNKFIDKQKLNKLEIDYLEKVIIIFKTFYSNGKSLIKDDIVYDLALNLLKSYRREPIVENLLVSRRTHDIVHEFPELKGTLDKCNKLTDDECERSNDKSLESYIRKWYEVYKSSKDKGYFILKFTRKFDGNSGVATIENGKIVLLVSRGEDGKGSDFTHLFKDVEFEFDDKERRGVQFEIIMTKEDFISYEEITGRKFSDPRSAVTSILTSSNGKKYSKYLSLAPIKMSDIDEADNKLLNEYYGDYINNFTYLLETSTSFDSLMIMVNKQIKEISNERDRLDYQIDGVVIECMNKSVREVYGRKNDINQWMVAYKFPPQVKYPKVTGLEITIGRTGLATPNLYYSDTYFNNRRYDHSSISSARRVENLNLRIGDIIGLSYNGDVMPYPFKYDCKENEKNDGEKIKFPKKCKCGYEFTRKGANYYCENPNCKEKIYDKIAFFYATLGIRDVSTKNVERLIKYGAITGFNDCLIPRYDIMYTIEGYGQKKIDNFEKEIKKLKNSKITEAKLMNALGITGEIQSKKILSVLPLDCILKNKNLLYETEIYSIGEKIKDKFIENLFNLKNEVLELRKQLNVVQNKVNDNTIKIIFTGFRPDENLIAAFELAGFELLDNYNNSVSYVIAKDVNGTSGTLKKARKNNKSIVTLEEFKNIIGEMKGE